MKRFLLSLLLVAANAHAGELVLVHGAHFSAESFRSLEMALPGSRAVHLGNDVSDGQSPSLQDYALKVCAKIRRKAVVLGHSQGGAVINHAFGLCPQKIAGFIYIAAVIPFPGEKPFALLAPRDDEYYFSAVRENSVKGVFEIFDHEKFVEGFAQDASSQEKKLIKKMAKDEPINPSGAKVYFDLSAYQKRPKAVLITEQDRIITAETQRSYLPRLSNTKVYAVNSGHLPMLTKKEDMLKIILMFLKEQ